MSTRAWKTGLLASNDFKKLPGYPSPDNAMRDLKLFVMDDGPFLSGLVFFLFFFPSVFAPEMSAMLNVKRVCVVYFDGRKRKIE